MDLPQDLVLATRESTKATLPIELDFELHCLVFAERPLEESMAKKEISETSVEFRRAQHLPLNSLSFL